MKGYLNVKRGFPRGHERETRFAAPEIGAQTKYWHDVRHLQRAFGDAACVLEIFVVAREGRILVSRRGVPTPIGAPASPSQTILLNLTHATRKPT
jgi:hypothetical protein